MADAQIRFSDGASYDAMMGAWSRSVGEIFLDWLRPPGGADWIDVGCGSGAFSSLVVERQTPRSILGIDPSEAQIDFARQRGLGPLVRFERGDAMQLPLADRSVDVAVAALVVHFMPEPATGVAEMARVTRPGGLVAAYAWDLAGGGFPYQAAHEAMRDFGLRAPDPPHPEAANADELLRLWTGTGLAGVAQRQIHVTRRFIDFDDYWLMATRSRRIAEVVERLDAQARSKLMEATRASVPSAPDGSVTPAARANAILGRVPAP